MYLRRPGASVRVRSWTPEERHYHGFLITHDEAISISEYFTLARDDSVEDEALVPLYRPTVLYAYHPSHDAVVRTASISRPDLSCSVS